MSERGFGAFGLKSGLRIRDEFAEDTAAERNTLVEIQPGKVVKDWQVHSGSAYKVSVSWPFYRYGEAAGANDTVRDVVNVVTTPRASSGELSRVLTRVESSAQVVSTAGTWHYDLETTTLYIRLHDSTNPNLITVFVKFGFFFASRMAVHPALTTIQRQLLTNGDFESLSGWAVVGSTSELDTGDFIEGQSSLKLELLSGSMSAYRERTITATYRENYRFAGYYKTDTVPGETNHVQAELFVGYVVGLDAHWINEDGRTEGVTGFDLPPTVGEWRRFVFDFVYNSDTPGDTTNLRVRVGGNSVTGTGNGTIHYDGLTLHHWPRMNLYEPRVSAASIPDYDVGIQDSFTGGHRTGIGSLVLANSDGFLEADLGGLVWENTGVAVHHSGRFEDDQQTTFDDRRTVFVGRIQSIETSDEQVRIALEDFQPGSDTVIPAANVNTTQFPLADPDAVGKPRPILLGKKTRIAPVKIDATNRIYEICNVGAAFWTPGIKAVDAVYKYATEEAADNDDPAGRTLLILTTDYTVDLTNGRITIVDAADDTFIRVDAQGFKDDGTGTYTGSADALISKAPDIARFIHERLVQQATVDTTSFAAGRALAPEPLGIYLSEATTARDLFDMIERSVLATITFGGLGQIAGTRALAWSDVGESDPATVLDMASGDFLTWDVQKRLRDIYSTVEVRYDQKATGEWLTESLSSATTPVVYHKNDTKVLETYLIQKADAIALATRVLELVSAVPRRIVANVHGKMLRRRLGQAVSVTRARGHGPALSATKFWISQMRHSFASNITQVELLEVYPGQTVVPGAPATLQPFVNEGLLRNKARRRRARAGWQELAYYPA